ncbi:S8 family serine peptidase, partial [Actinomadura sp.]|uniref:S8 family peptidase n=1 Tax=Actinomadura sp. TaxID=1989 RepID=UPI0037C952FF
MRTTTASILRASARSSFLPTVVWSIRRTVVWVSVAFVLLTLPVAAEGQPGHRARLSRGLSQAVAAGRTKPVILSGSPREMRALAARHGLPVRKVLPSGVVVEVADSASLEALSSDPAVPVVAEDARVFANMANEVVSLGADQAWAGLLGVDGVTGRGVGVAVIDSGILARHEALAGRVVASVDFVGIRGRGDDTYGHGTHVAGIIAGAVVRGAGRFSGVAPGAHLVSLKVLDEDGSGETSTVIEAIDWVIANRELYQLRVINLSLGKAVLESWQDDPLVQAVERAVSAGLVVVTSAGNWGTLPDGTRVRDGITSPGNAPSAITVGALDTMGTPERSDDRPTDWSSRGMTAIDQFLKPDVAAPGRRVLSAGVAKSTLGSREDAMVTGAGPRFYQTLSGTSQAAAMVAGVAALVLEARPTLAPHEVKALLQLTAQRVENAGVAEVGAGAVNAAAAVLAAGAGYEGQAPTTIAGELVERAELMWNPNVGA